MQMLLTHRGYDIGTPDGILGQKTRTAVQDFQVRAGMLRTAIPASRCSRSCGTEPQPHFRLDVSGAPAFAGAPDLRLKGPACGSIETG